MNKRKNIQWKKSAFISKLQHDTVEYDLCSIVFPQKVNHVFSYYYFKNESLIRTTKYNFILTFVILFIVTKCYPWIPLSKRDIALTTIKITGKEMLVDWIVVFDLKTDLGKTSMLSSFKIDILATKILTPFRKICVSDSVSSSSKRIKWFNIKLISV